MQSNCATRTHPISLVDVRLGNTPFVLGCAFNALVAANSFSARDPGLRFGASLELCTGDMTAVHVSVVELLAHLSSCVLIFVLGGLGEFSESECEIGQGIARFKYT